LKEARYAMLARSDPQRSEQLLQLAQEGIDERWHFYEQLAGVERAMQRSGNDEPTDDTTDAEGATDA